MTTNEQYGLGDLARALADVYREAKARKIEVPLSEPQRWLLFLGRWIFLLTFPPLALLTHHFIPMPWILLAPAGYLLMTLALPPWTYRRFQWKTGGTNAMLVLAWILWMTYLGAEFVVPLASDWEPLAITETQSGFFLNHVPFLIGLVPYVLFGGFLINPWWPLYPHKHILLDPPKVQNAA